MPTTVSMSRCSQSESLESSLSVSPHEVEMPAVTEESLSVSPHEVEMPAVNEEASSLPSYLNLSTWISVLLIKLQAKYKLSDNVMLAFVSVLRLLFAIISHPLQYYFPRTIQGLSIQLGVNSMPAYTKFIVYPNSECSELYSTTFQLDTSEIHKCTKLHYGLQCNRPLLYGKLLSFGKRQFVRLFIYHQLPCLKCFMAMKVLRSYFLYNYNILLEMIGWWMFGMVMCGSHLSVIIEALKMFLFRFVPCGFDSKHRLV